jgi:predicted ATPase
VRKNANQFEVTLAAADRTFVLTLPLDRRHAAPRKSFQMTRAESRPNSEVARGFEYLRWTARMRLDAEEIAAPAVAPASGDAPSVRNTGAGLAVFLQYLLGLRDGTFDAIESSIKAVIPRFKRLQFRPARVLESVTQVRTVDGQELETSVTRSQAGTELWIEFDDGAVVPARHASEGTLLTLALLTMAHASQHHRRQLLLIDDIDRALHPAAQFELIKLLRAAIAATPDLQIIATTHSPDLVDACTPDEVRVLGFGSDGFPAARPLASHPEAAEWLKRQRPGEFWSTVGEAWVAGSPPVAR